MTQIQVPSFILDEIKLRRARRIHRLADYIRSPHVARGARIGQSVGIGKDVVVNDNVSIGNYTYINKGALILSGTIGQFCSIAHYAQIGAEQHPTRHLSTSPFVYGNRNLLGAEVAFEEIENPPTIGNDVWIGSAAVIQQGVSIGDGAIIASGSVVTRDVMPFTIVAGIPARILRDRFSEEQVATIRRNPWWDYPADELDLFKKAAESGDEWQQHYPF
jgi:virginiamycin A acetyltransferase